MKRKMKPSSQCSASLTDVMVDGRRVVGTLRIEGDDVKAILAKTDWHLTDDAVAYVLGLFNSDEALEYLRNTCVPSDVADEAVRSCEEAIRAALGRVAWRVS